MKAVFKTRMLQAAVSAVVGAVGKSNSPKQAYSQIKATFGPQTTLAATDGEVSIVRQVPEVIVDSPGETLLPADKLTAILRESTAEEILIECIDGIAHIKSGSSRFKIPLNVADDFPPSPKFEAVDFVTVTANDIAKIVERSVFQDDKNSSYALASVHFHLDGDLYAVTCDSRKLGYVQSTVKKTGEAVIAMANIPTKAMRLIGSLASDGDVDVSLLPNSAIFRTQFGVVSTQLVGGRYPDFRRVYPDKVGRTAIPFVASSLANAIRQCVITTSEESKAVKFSFKDGTLSLSASAANAGSSDVSMPVGFAGEMSFSLNPEFMLKALKLIEPTAVVQFMPLDSESTVLVESECGLRYVQMPISKE